MTHEITDQNLRTALANDELVYFYQPKVNLLRGQVCGIEALIRWIKPNGEILPPDSFIHDAERSGFIREISLAMLDKLVADTAIIKQVRPDLAISFNVTAQDFTNDDFVNKWKRAASSGQIDPHLFQIEVTETRLINSSPTVQKNIQTVVDTGASLAMDDLGTGHSTLDVLSQWPFRIVKIDQGLIRRMQHEDKSATIVRNAIHMAHQLGLKIVAEGVETEEVYNFLLTSGCTEVQGFLLGFPMPLDQLISFLKEEKRWPASPAGLIHMAQSDHLQWRRQLIEYTISKIYNRPSMATSNKFYVESDPHRCLLGQWYYGIGKTYIGNPAYDALEAPHNLLHEIGQKIQTDIENNVPSSEIISLLRQLTEVSGKILSLLQKLELEALLVEETKH